MRAVADLRNNYYLWFVVTNIQFPTVYHIGEERDIRESEITEERYIMT